MVKDVWMNVVWQSFKHVRKYSFVGWKKAKQIIVSKTPFGKIIIWWAWFVCMPKYFIASFLGIICKITVTILVWPMYVHFNVVSIIHFSNKNKIGYHEHFFANFFRHIFLKSFYHCPCWFLTSDLQFVIDVSPIEFLFIFLFSSFSEICSDQTEHPLDTVWKGKENEQKWQWSFNCTATGYLQETDKISWLPRASSEEAAQWNQYCKYEYA